MNDARQDLEGRFERRLRAELDAAVRPFSTSEIVSRAMDAGGARTARRRGLTLATAVMVALLALLVLGAVVLVGALRGGLAVEVTQTVDLGAGVARSMTAGDGALWIVRPAELDRVNPTTGAITPIALGTQAFDPVSVAYGFGSVWVLDEGGALLRIDPGTGSAIAKIPIQGELRDCHVAVGGDAVWVSLRDAMVVRVDPATDTVAKTVEVTSSASGLLATPGAVWVDGAGELIRIVLPASAQLGSVDLFVQDDMAAGLAPAANGVWVGSGLPGAVVNVSNDLEIVRSVDTRSHPLALATEGEWLWVGEADGTVEVIDTRDGSVRGHGTIGKYVRDLAVIDGSVWAFSQQAGVLYRLAMTKNATPTPTLGSPAPSLDPADVPIGWPLLPEDPAFTAGARAACLTMVGADPAMPFAAQERREPDWAIVYFANDAQIVGCSVHRAADGTIQPGDPYGFGVGGSSSRDSTGSHGHLTIAGAADATDVSPLYWSNVTGLVPERAARVLLIAGGKAAEAVIFDGTYAVSWQGMVKPTLLVAYDASGNEIDRIGSEVLDPMFTHRCDPQSIGGC